MTRISLALVSLVLVFAAACGGSDKKDGGGLLGGGGSSGSGANSNDPAVFSRQVIVTLFNVFGGSADPQKLLDLYAPDCRAGVKASDVASVVALIKLFVPDISKLKLEDVDLGNPKVDKLPNGEYRVTVPDPSKVRFKVNGKFIPADDFLKQIGFDDPDDAPFETDEPLLLKEIDGKLYVADCADLKDIAGGGLSGPTPTPVRSSSASPTPQRSTAGTPSVTSTPGRTATTTTSSATATVTRGTPAAVATIVRTTPTAAQRYPAALEQEFMGDCTRAGSTTAVCRCMLDILEARYNVTQYREFEREIDSPSRQGEVNAIIQACVR